MQSRIQQILRNHSRLWLPLRYALILTFLVVLPAPGEGSGDIPSIISVEYKQVQGGDSFRMFADGPFPKAFIESGNRNIQIEFNRLNLKYPTEGDSSYSEDIQGSLTDHFDIKVTGNPPQTKVAFRISDGAEYSYSYVKHSLEMVEMLITKVGASFPKPTPKEGSKDIPTLTPFKPSPPKEITLPDEVKPSGLVPTKTKQIPVINKVKYFPLDGDADRIEFTCQGVMQDPKIRVRDFPPRLEIAFANAEVRLPVKTKYGPFLTPVPGKTINRLKAWNRNSDEGGSIFELFLTAEGFPDWKTVKHPDGRLTLDLSFKEQGKPVSWLFALPRKPGVIDEPKLEFEALFVRGPKPGKGQEEGWKIKVVKLDAIELDLNWPEDEKLLIAELKQITSGLGPGLIVEIPLKLRLHFMGNPYDAPYPGMEP